ncbi:unnamed protein product, partial [Scytosiphon promiscuus]
MTTSERTAAGPPVRRNLHVSSFHCQAILASVDGRCAVFFLLYVRTCCLCLTPLACPSFRKATTAWENERRAVVRVGAPGGGAWAMILVVPSFNHPEPRRMPRVYCHRT